MEEIVRTLRSYFKFLEKHKASFENAISKSKKPLSSLSSLSERLQAVSNCPEDSKIVQHFPEIKCALTFKVLISLEKEVDVLKNIISELEESTRSLCKQFATVEDTIISSRENSSGSSNEIPFAPVTVDQLLECALDCRQYYQALYCGIRSAYVCLNYRESCSISKLKSTFIEDKNLLKHIKRCLAVGQSLQDVEIDTNLID